MAFADGLQPVCSDCLICPYTAINDIIRTCNERLTRMSECAPVYTWRSDGSYPEFAALFRALSKHVAWLSLFPRLFALGPYGAPVTLTLAIFRDAFHNSQMIRAALARQARLTKRWNRCIHDDRVNPIATAFCLAARRLPPHIAEFVLERAPLVSLACEIPQFGDLTALSPETIDLLFATPASGPFSSMHEYIIR